MQIDGYSLDAQKTKMKAFGDYNEYEIAEILTHAAFYAGWSKAWAAFRLATEVWSEEVHADDERANYEKNAFFDRRAE